MIVSSMVFLLVVSAVACAAALAMEAGLGRMGAPMRFAWLGALALGPTLLAAKTARLLDVLRANEPPAWVPVFELPALELTPAVAATNGLGVESAAAVLWILAGFGLIALVVRTYSELLTERSGWESKRVLEWDVYVSADRGPAVAGVRKPWIVLPRWVLSLPERELRMVLLHEQEHLRARDTRLLGVALALVVLSAWNPVTWWQLRRLRAAMELDCDRRVLRTAPDTAAYGSSLLSVAARASGLSLGLAAFTERSLNLKRRILAMTAKTSRWTALGGGVLVVVGTVVGVQACGVETPIGPAPTANVMPVEEPEQAAPVRPNPEDGPVFTPFTVTPTLVNRDEVAKALETEYPPLLRGAGVGGMVQVWVFVDEDGTVGDVRIHDSSGQPALDDAALRVARVFRFSPALNRDEKVAVWVSLPITFASRKAEAPTIEEPEIAPPAIEPPELEAAAPDPSAAPVFTPFTVAPTLVNRDEVARALEREYPPVLRQAGVGGSVRVWIFITEDGTVTDARIDRSSGQPAIDEAAVRVARTMRFSAALNGDETVVAWVSIPITFMVR